MGQHLTYLKAIEALQKGREVTLDNQWKMLEIISRHPHKIECSAIKAVCPHCQKAHIRSLGCLLNRKKLSNRCIECQRKYVRDNQSKKPVTYKNLVLSIEEERLRNFRRICREKGVSPQILLLSAIDNYINKNS